MSIKGDLMDKDTKQMFDLVLDKLGVIDKRLDNVDKRLDNADKRFDRMETRQDEIYRLLSTAIRFTR